MCVASLYLFLNRRDVDEGMAAASAESSVDAGDRCEIGAEKNCRPAGRAFRFSFTSARESVGFGVEVGVVRVVFLRQFIPAALAEFPFAALSAICTSDHVFLLSQKGD